MKTITCPDCNQTKPLYANGLCQLCWRKRYYDKNATKAKRYSKEYYAEHGAKVQRRRAQRQTCDILIKHAEDHKDDDDKLKSGFIVEQLDKFNDKVYDKKDLKLLSQKPGDSNES